MNSTGSNVDNLTQKVMIDHFKASSQPEESFRHPNDVNDRNANYFDEDRRNMAGIEASVRHVSIFVCM